MSDDRTTAPPIYLGISGVLHPSESIHTLVFGHPPWEDGHTKYENVPALLQALENWPDVKLVLTSTQPLADGLNSVLAQLGLTLAARVVGYGTCRRGRLRSYRQE
jgi:hypothetical protein